MATGLSLLAMYTKNFHPFNRNTGNTRTASSTPYSADERVDYRCLLSTFLPLMSTCLPGRHMEVFVVKERVAGGVKLVSSDGFSAALYHGLARAGAPVVHVNYSVNGVNRVKCHRFLSLITASPVAGSLSLSWPTTFVTYSATATNSVSTPLSLLRAGFPLCLKKYVTLPSVQLPAGPGVLDLHAPGMEYSSMLAPYGGVVSIQLTPPTRVTSFTGPQRMVGCPPIPSAWGPSEMLVQSKSL